jgi:hypothetical protein
VCGASTGHSPAQRWLPAPPSRQTRAKPRSCRPRRGSGPPRPLSLRTKRSSGPPGCESAPCRAKEQSGRTHERSCAAWGTAVRSAEASLVHRGRGASRAVAPKARRRVRRRNPPPRHSPLRTDAFGMSHGTSPSKAHARSRYVNRIEELSPGGDPTMFTSPGRLMAATHGPVKRDGPCHPEG